MTKREEILVRLQVIKNITKGLMRDENDTGNIEEDKE